MQLLAREKFAYPRELLSPVGVCRCREIVWPLSDCGDPKRPLIARHTDVSNDATIETLAMTFRSLSAIGVLRQSAFINTLSLSSVCTFHVSYSSYCSRARSALTVDLGKKRAKSPHHRESPARRMNYLDKRTR